MTHKSEDAQVGIERLSAEYLSHRETLPWRDAKPRRVMKELHQIIGTTRKAPPNALLERLEQDYGELRRDHALAKEFYFRQFLPLIVPSVEDQANHVKWRQMNHTVLVSLMGMSPETTVIATCILRPKALLIIQSSGPDATEGAEHAIDYLVRSKVISNQRHRTVIVDEFDPQHIYAAIRKALASMVEEFRLHTSLVALDLTGGTKVMSAAGGTFAWEQRLESFYLKGKWDTSRGMARLTSNYELMPLPNPSERQGVELRRAGLESWRKSDFNSAAASFRDSANLLHDNAFDAIAHRLSLTYLALLDLDRDKLKASLNKLVGLAKEHRIQSLLRQAPGSFLASIEVIKEVSDGNSSAILATLAVLAEIYHEQGRYSLAVLLSYRFMEQLVADQLKKRHGFQMGKPDYALLCKDMDREELDAQFQKLLSKNPYPLPPKVGLLEGFILLVIVDRVHERFGSGKMAPLSAIGKLMDAATKRNESIWSHGTKTMTVQDSEVVAECSERLRLALMDTEDLSSFTNRMEQLKPMDLSQILPESK